MLSAFDVDHGISKRIPGGFSRQTGKLIATGKKVVPPTPKPKKG